MAREIDWGQYYTLKAQGSSGRQIAEAMKIPETSLYPAQPRGGP